MTPDDTIPAAAEAVSDAPSDEPVAPSDEPAAVLEPAETPRTDVVLGAAIELAREAAVAVGGEHVGEHLGLRAEDEHVLTHAFAATLPGYVGWFWAVTLARAVDAEPTVSDEPGLGGEPGVDDERDVDGEPNVGEPSIGEPTVDEVVLLPGDGALLAPAWVPWDERVQPGDLSPGDLLPPRADDPRLVPAYVLSDDAAVEAVALELGLGREQVMSRDGRVDTAERWYAGDRGPDSPMARQAPGHCGTCGFFLPLAGSLQAGFGVCGNEVTDSDGAVVSVEYGCGAHSQVQATPTRLAEAPEIVWDDGDDVVPNEPAAEQPAQERSTDA